MKYIVVILMALCGYGIIGNLYYKYSSHCFTEIVYALRNGEQLNESEWIKRNEMTDRAVKNLSDEWDVGLIGSISGMILGTIHFLRKKSSAQQE